MEYPGIASGDTEHYSGKRIPFMGKDLGAMFEHRPMKLLDAALVTSRMHYPLIYKFTGFPAALPIMK